MAFWVYMLQCVDQSYYVGHTNDLEKRILEHQTGDLDGYTATRRPVRVVFTQELPSREEALAAELQIKGWSRKKKQALIRGDWSDISRLARRRQPFPAR
jgi:predicted GIY-YIG superfamily endonuclease